MIDKMASYAYFRPFYLVDENVQIIAGQIAFLSTNAAGNTVATTAASGTVPIGTFWKDATNAFQRTTMESQAFGATTNVLTVRGGNIVSTNTIRITNTAGTVIYTQGTDYSITTANGLVTRIATGAITAGQTVTLRYSYNVSNAQLQYEMSSTRWSTGQNYNQGRDDTEGSSRIAIAEGDATIYTDQYVPNVNYTLNAPLRSDSASLWTTSALGSGAISSVCGRVIQIPSVANPFLGVAQVRVPQ